MKNHQNIKSWLGLVILLVILIILVTYFSRQLQEVGNFIRQLGWLGWLASILLFGIFGITPIPSEPVTVLVTTIFGPLSAAAITALGHLLAAILEFWIGNKLGGLVNFNKLREKLPWGLNKMRMDSPIFLIVARMIPGYGPKFVSMNSGIYKVPLLRYLWTTILVTTLGALIVAFGGNRILLLLGYK